MDARLIGGVVCKTYLFKQNISCYRYQIRDITLNKYPLGDAERADHRHRNPRPARFPAR